FRLPLPAGRRRHMEVVRHTPLERRSGSPFTDRRRGRRQQSREIGSRGCETASRALVSDRTSSQAAPRRSSMTTVIEVEGLTKRYGAHLAVDEVGFTVAEGEIFGILGVNGAGKTTTVECLQGLRRPDRGRMRVLGLAPQSAGSRLRALVGSQLQASALPDRLR